MTAALKPAIQPTRETATASGLDDDSGIIIVDTELAEIVAANSAGTRAIGLFAYASFPVALDTTTPALARLRELAALGATSAKSIERLTFWSNGRLKSVQCTVSHQPGDRAGLFILHIVDDQPQSAQGGVTDLPPSEVRVQRDDVGVASLDPSYVLAPTLAPSPASILDPDHLAKLAHELKTPLTAIAAAAEIMRDERLGAMGNSRYLSYAADIHENATHALDVIVSLLTESVKSGAAQPRLIALDLNAVVERTVSSIQALAQSRQLTLRLNVDKSRPHVVANPTALRQILLNLLTNAIKFTPPGGDIRVDTGYLAGDRVYLSVSDTGCGISGNMAAASVGAERNHTRQPWLSGSGIGLPLVQRLAREMCAEFEIDSAPNTGTVARILFGGFARWPA